MSRFIRRRFFCIRYDILFSVSNVSCRKLLDISLFEIIIAMWPCGAVLRTESTGQVPGRVSIVPEKPHVNIRTIVNDIRSGMADHELMAKYGLSVKGLHRAFEKLVDLKALTRGDLENRFPSAADSIYFESMRELPRHYVVIPIPIHELGPPQKSGMLRDITEKGVGVVGIEAKVGETKVFAIYPNEFVTVSPFSFKAICRWTEGKAPGDSVGGFAITEISEDALEKLRQLIGELTFGES
jgi:hypothetical protein